MNNPTAHTNPWISRLRQWRPKSSWSVLLRRLAMVCLAFAVLGGMIIAVAIWRLSANLPDVNGLATYESAQTSKLYSHDGQIIATMQLENRADIPLQNMSEYLVKALLAVEDEHFYQHKGVDWMAAGRAAVANTLFGGIDQGASTITMQLARTRFLNQDLTFSRKLREILLARRIEQRFAKDKILEYYLNNVYFGSGAYGVGAATSLYFNRTPDQLTIAQAAMIAGLVQAPSKLSPLTDRKAAVQRMKVVLGRMKQVGLISEPQYQQAVYEGENFRFTKKTLLKTLSMGNILKYPYFTTYVMAELGRVFPEEMLYQGGLAIHTDMGGPLQEHGQF